MDYARPQLAERLAAEYAMGTLRGPARRRFEALLTSHPNLRRAVHDWERRLQVLADSTPPVAPRPEVWSRIERRLFSTATRDAAAANDAHDPSPGAIVQRWWQRLGLWQGATGLASAAAVVLAVLISRPQPEAPAQPPIVVVMAAQPGVAATGIQPAGFVASVSGDGRSLVLKPLDEHQQVAVNKALELWAVPAQGAPRSLGLVSDHGLTTVLRAQLLKNTAAFAVSVEPPGGSPTGAPTGPVISVGKLQL